MITFTELLERAKSEQIAIHTPTEEQAKTLLKVLDEKGYEWASGIKLTAATRYGNYKENTCYDFAFDFRRILNKKVCVSPLVWFPKHDYTIIKFTDIDFTEKPLKVLPPTDIKTIYQSKDKLTTCVVFEDGTKVKVKKHKGDKGSIYTAVAYAITKKTYGSNKVFTEIVDEKLYKGEINMKRLMISVHPEWVQKILNGEKTIEVRPWIPKGELPLEVLIYVAKREPYLYNNWNSY